MKMLEMSTKMKDLSIYSIGVFLMISFIGYSIIMYKKATNKRAFLIEEHYGDRYFFGYHGYKDKALIHYKEALQLEPENQIMHTKLCRTYYHLCVIKDTSCEEAQVQLNKSIEQFPDVKVLKEYRSKLIQNINDKTNQVVLTGQ